MPNNTDSNAISLTSLAGLSHLTQALTNQNELSLFLAQALDIALDRTGAERGFLLSLEQEAPLWKLLSTRNLGHESLEHEALQAVRAAVEAVVARGAGLVRADLPSDPDLGEWLGKLPGAPRSLACLPLIIGEQVTGVLYLDHRTEAGLFDEERQSFLEILVAQVALAIENARLSETLQQVHQTKSKFVSVVTHELRIPMTSIKGYTDLLRQGAVGPVNDMQLNFLNVIRSNVERMSSLVSDLADLSRMEGGRLKLECEHVSVMDSLGEALNGVRPALQGKNLQLTVEAGPDLPKAFTDPNRLVQILNILLSNAWKYTPEEGKIQVSVRRQASTLFFEVRDTGIGISRQDQEKLFTQFFRSDDSVVREQQGWGLGLAVARGLVQLSGGAMGFESQPGQGSAFWFTLPLDAISVKDPRPLGKDEKTKTG